MKRGLSTNPHRISVALAKGRRLPGVVGGYTETHGRLVSRYLGHCLSGPGGNCLLYFVTSVELIYKRLHRKI